MTYGRQGPPGQNGLSVLTGSGSPSNGTGRNGQVYIDKLNWVAYFKLAGAWDVGTSLRGAAGVTPNLSIGVVSTLAAGSTATATITGTTTNPLLNLGLVTGQTGGTGLNGSDGRTVLTTSGAPSNGVGNNGDFAYDPTAKIMYGPKSSGSWPAGVSLTGANGTDGKTLRNGTGAPSNGLGVDGDYYIATNTNYIYGPKASGIWPSGVSLVGPVGPTYALLDPASIAAISTGNVARSTGSTITRTTQFACAEAKSCTGARLYAKNAVSETATFTLWTAAGVQLAQKSTASGAVNGTGYFGITWDSPIALSAETIYFIGVYIPLVDYAFGGDVASNIHAYGTYMWSNGAAAFDSTWQRSIANTFPNARSISGPPSKCTVAAVYS